MPDERDPRLLRAFAEADGELPEEPFLSQVTSRLRAAHGPASGAAAVYSLLGTVLGSVATGILLPLRMRRVRLMTLGAAAFTIVAAFL